MTTSRSHHLLQKLTELDISVPVVRVFHRRSFAKQSVGFVEKQNGIGVLCGIEDTPQILFRLADVLADDFVEIYVQFVGKKVPVRVGLRADVDDYVAMKALHINGFQSTSTRALQEVCYQISSEPQNFIDFNKAWNLVDQEVDGSNPFGWPLLSGPK